MRNLLILLLATSLASCYENTTDSDIKEVIEESPEVIVDADLTGLIVGVDHSELSQIRLITSGNEYQTSGNPYYLPLTQTSKYSNTLIATKENRPIAIGTRPIVRNDINIIDLQPIRSVEQDLNRPSFSISQGHITVDGEDENSTSVLLGSLDPSTSLHGYLIDETVVLLDIAAAWVLQGYNNDQATQLTAANSMLVDFTTINPSGYDLFRLDDRGRWIEHQAQISSEKLLLEEYGYYILASSTRARFVSGDYNLNGESIAYQAYRTGSTSNHYSTASGQFITIAAADFNTSLEAVSPCGEIIQSTALPSSSTDIVDKSISLDISDNYHHRVRTRIISCDGSTSDTPILKVINQGASRSLYLFGQSQIESWIPVCDDNFALSAYDKETSTYGPPIPWSQQMQQDIDYLSSCSDWSDGYVFLEVNGEQKPYDQAFNYQLENDILTVEAPDQSLSINIKGSTTGTYAVEDVNIFLDDRTLGSGYFINCRTSPLGCGIEELEVTHLDTTDGWLRVTFSGVLWMQRYNPLTAANFPVSGQILIKT